MGNNQVYILQQWDLRYGRARAEHSSKSQYAISRLNEIKGVIGSRFNTVNFKEFVVDFNATGKTVKEINKELLLKAYSEVRTCLQSFLKWDNAPCIV